MNKLLINNMLGKMYPFFLGNYNFPDSYYLYQFSSPCLDEELNPMLSFEKIGERLKGKDANTFNSGNGIDVLTACSGAGSELDYLNMITRRENTTIVENGKNFPNIEMVDNINIQKSIVVSMRDTIRWKYYKFFPGRKVDILWSPFEFVVFEFESDKDFMWLKPVGIYKTFDTELSKPLDYNLESLDYPKDKWEKSSNSRASEINKVIKKLEWNAFERRALTKKIK